MTVARPHFFTIVTTYFSYGILIAIGHLRDFLARFSRTPTSAVAPPGYAPLVNDFSGFFIRRLYNRARDCFNRPIGGVAGAYVDVLERVSPDYNISYKQTGKVIHALNLGSYNYLGFADLNSIAQTTSKKSLEQYGTVCGSSSISYGYTTVHAELEDLVARFTGKEAALVFGMGFATNSLGLPSLMGKGSLIISDTLNHTSIVVGARNSGAKIRVFKHNDPNDLELIIREAIAEGQPRTHRPWTKIMIVVEGIYSMEGEICKLKEIVRIKKKYKAYLYLDEAHSIGALGATGRGCVEYCGVDPKDVDIMMGTFTKSFGSVGGYIAADKGLISVMQASNAGTISADSLAPVCAMQALTALRVICGEDGTTDGKAKIAQLRDNANWMRKVLAERGFEILGDDDSPIIPVMIYNPAKAPAFSRELLKRKVAVVVVGFPATPLLENRVRICLSAAHSRADLIKAADAITEVGDMCGFRYRSHEVQPLAQLKSKKE